MKFGNVFLGALVFLALLAVPANAQTADSARVTVCAPAYPVTATASIGAGYINFCVNYPPEVMPGSTFNIISTITAPASTAPVFNNAAGAFLNFVGCTEGTPNVNPPVTNGVVGTMNTFTTTATMTAEQCDAVTTVAFTIGAVPLNIYITYLPITVLTENVRVDNFDYLCDAPAIAPNAYSTTATTCNDPNIALSGSLTLAGIPDTQQEIQAIADALSAGLDVMICPQSDPCYQVLSGSIDTNSTTTMGNVTVPQSIEISFPGDVDAPGLDFWTLFLFWAVVLGGCLYMGWFFAAGFALPGLLDAMFPAAIPETFSVWFVFVLLGVCMEAAAAKFSWGPYRNRRGIMK